MTNLIYCMLATDFLKQLEDKTLVNTSEVNNFVLTVKVAFRATASGQYRYNAVNIEDVKQIAETNPELFEKINFSLNGGKMGFYSSVKLGNLGDIIPNQEFFVSQSYSEKHGKTFWNVGASGDAEKRRKLLTYTALDDELGTLKSLKNVSATVFESLSSDLVKEARQELKSDIELRAERRKKMREVNQTRREQLKAYLAGQTVEPAKKEDTADNADTNVDTPDNTDTPITDTADTVITGRPPVTT